MAQTELAPPAGDAITRFFARLGIHYAWVVAAVTFFAALVAAGAAGSVGVMMLPLQIEFGWTPAEISSALGLRLALFGLVAPFAAALEDVRRPVEQSFLPLMDHGRMHAIFGGQLRHRPLALHGLKRNPSLEARVMVPAFPHS